MANRNFMENLKRRHYLDDAPSAAVAVSSSTTETAFLASRIVRLQNDIHVGLNIFWRAYGTLTTTDAGTGNDLDFALRYGSTDITQIEANNLGTNASIIPWVLDGGARILTIGSSGKIVATQKLWVGQATSQFYSSATVAAGISVDLSAPNLFDVSLQWGTSNASNLCTVYAGELRFMEGA